MSVSNVRINMDLCYSDSLHDFRGCFFNYQLNKYLSRGLDPDEYLKVYGTTNMPEIRALLKKRHEFTNPRHALLEYRDFCKAAHFKEKDIRDFFSLCLWYVKWCVTNLPANSNPFGHALVQEILQDLAEIVYRQDSEGKVKGIMHEAHERLQDSYTPGSAFLVCEELFDRVINDWNIEHEYAGDDHGQRLKSIFCAQSIGQQKCANVAIARGFHEYYRDLPEETRYPRAQPEVSSFPRANCFFLFVNNPFNLQSLESEFVMTSKVVNIGSRADFFQSDFPFSTPDQLSNESGAIREQRTHMLIALAAGKNFIDNPSCDILARNLDEVKPFRNHTVSDWVDFNESKAFGLDVDWEGRSFVNIGQARPGLYLDALSLAALVRDEESLQAVAGESYRKSIVGMAPKKLQGVTVPGEVTSVARGEKKRKRSRVDTGEDGTPVRKPFETEAVKDADPKEESDNSTIAYAIMGIGTFLGILFLSNKA